MQFWRHVRTDCDGWQKGENSIPLEYNTRKNVGQRFALTSPGQAGNQKTKIYRACFNFAKKKKSSFKILHSLKIFKRKLNAANRKKERDTHTHRHTCMHDRLPCANVSQPHWTRWTHFCRLHTIYSHPHPSHRYTTPYIHHTQSPPHLHSTLTSHPPPPKKPCPASWGSCQLCPCFYFQSHSPQDTASGTPWWTPGSQGGYPPTHSHLHKTQVHLNSGSAFLSLSLSVSLSLSLLKTNFTDTCLMFLFLFFSSFFMCANLLTSTVSFELSWSIKDILEHKRQS